MLKRCRESSPPPSFQQTQEDESDLYHPDAKRLRYFEPSKSDNPIRSGLGEELQGIEDTSSVSPNAQERVRGRGGSRKDGGQYSNTNSLLHDLHAEQRHRMLFSSSSLVHLSHSFQRTPSPADTLEKETGDLSYLPENALSKLTPVLIHIPSEEGVNPDEPEAKLVTERYEDTNKFLRDLFLNRRRELTVGGSRSLSS